VAHDLENISENFQIGKGVIFVATTFNLNTSKEKKGLLSVQTKGLFSEKGDRLHEPRKSRRWISTHFIWIEAADYYTIWNPYSFCHTCENTQGSHVPFVHEIFLRSGRRSFSHNSHRPFQSSRSRAIDLRISHQRKKETKTQTKFANGIVQTSKAMAGA